MKDMRYLIALLALAGIVVSSMALHIHYMDTSAVPPCSVSEHWDCGTVRPRLANLGKATHELHRVEAN